MWVYEQKTGLLHDPSGDVVAKGYAGYGIGFCNPDVQAMPNVGPLPQGDYTIGAAHMPVDYLGPLALPLYPAATNEMFGRFGFFIHGDNARMNCSASNGCIILPHPVREQIANSGDAQLRVISGIETGSA